MIFLENLADPSSLIESFHTALSILKNRKQFEEINSNPLKVKELKSVKNNLEKVNLLYSHTFIKMKRSEKHILKFAGLKDGNHIFSYEINNRFFHHFNFNDFNQSSFKIDINLVKKATVLDLKINSKGLVNVDCSVSNEPFDYDLNSKLDLIVKFGEFYDDSNDELIVLPMVHTR